MVLENILYSVGNRNRPQLSAKPSGSSNHSVFRALMKSKVGHQADIYEIVSTTAATSKVKPKLSVVIHKQKLYWPAAKLFRQWHINSTILKLNDLRTTV